MKIHISNHLSSKSYEALRRKYAKNKNASISLPTDLSVTEIRDLVNLILHQPLDIFGYVLLADMAESPLLPLDLLEEIYQKGDVGCRVAIALRDDLPEQLKILCMASPEDTVREHFFARKAYRDE